MANETSFQKAVQEANSGKRFPAMSLVNSDAGIAAVLSKLVQDREPRRFNNQGQIELDSVSTSMFKETSENTAQSISDAETVMQVLPDMELTAQIIVSSIISPKDMMTTELTYSVTEGLMAPEVSASMIGIVKTYFEQVHKIKPMLPKMLRDMLFMTGSYAIAVIPENSIDEAINGPGKITLESLSEEINSDGSLKPLGLLGPIVKKTPTTHHNGAGISMESFMNYDTNQTVDGAIRFSLEENMKDCDTSVTVTDNYNLLKIPRINQKNREDRIVSAVRSHAMESISYKLNDRELSSMLYKTQQSGYKPIAALKTQEQLSRNTVGNPLILHIPSEAVIPVFVPGRPEAQIGFFVLVDADGNPLTKVANKDYYREMGTRLSANGNFPSAMLAKVKSQMEGFNSKNRQHIDATARIYGTMVERELIERLRNGAYGNGVALAKKEEIYRIMLARTLSKQRTQLLFIPAELMTYFAFSYNDDGIGKSTLEDQKILNSLRSMLTFATTMAALRNSVGRTEVKMKLDEDDPNPQKTIEIAMNEIMKTRNTQFPLGISSPTDQVDYIQRAGLEFTFEGHPMIPDVNVDFGEKNSNYAKPDTDLMDVLRKQSIMAAGLSPESVDASFNPEFATSVVTNNILLAKRVMQRQEQFTPQLTDHHRKVIMNSENAIKSLREILENNYEKVIKYRQPQESDLPLEVGHQAGVVPMNQKLDDLDIEKKHALINRFLNEFIMNLEVSLPSPNSVSLENQLAALETYSKALDQTLDAWVSDKFLTTDMVGDVSNPVNTIKEVLKAYYLRKWMAENGVMTELADLTTVGSDGEPVVDIFKMQAAHLESLAKTLTKYMTNLQPSKDANNAALQAAGADNLSATSSSDGGESSGGNDDFSSFGGDFDLEAAGTGGEGSDTDEASLPETPETPEEPKEETSEGETKKNETTTTPPPETPPKS